MQKLFSIICLGLFSLSSYGGGDCPRGSTSSWKYDQKKNVISLDFIQSQKVCHFVTKQLNANVEFVFYKEGKKVFSNQVYWAGAIWGDTIEKGKFRAVSAKSVDYKILKLPVQSSDIDSFEVRELASGKVLGKGGTP